MATREEDASAKGAQGPTESVGLDIRGGLEKKSGTEADIKT